MPQLCSAYVSGKKTHLPAVFMICIQDLQKHLCGVCRSVPLVCLTPAKDMREGTLA